MANLTMYTRSIIVELAEGVEPDMTSGLRWTHALSFALRPPAVVDFTRGQHHIPKNWFLAS